MADTWTWDETLYAGSAPHYVAGRMPYPLALGEAIASAVGLDGTQTLLDVGCGPGSLTRLLVAFVSRAIGIDADAGMIAAARAAAPDADFRLMRAEQLPADLGAVDAVTFAQSFHWLERERVAAIVRTMLAPGGSCVHVGATTHRCDESTDLLPCPRPPHDAIDELVRIYLGPGRRAGRSLRPGDPLGGSEPAVFRAAGFRGPDCVEVTRGEIVTRTIDDVVAATFSLSGSTPHQLGDRAPEFERELRALLAAASAPDGCFSERLRDITVDVYRP